MLSGLLLLRPRGEPASASGVAGLLNPRRPRASPSRAARKRSPSLSRDRSRPAAAALAVVARVPPIRAKAAGLAADAIAAVAVVVAVASVEGVAIAPAAAPRGALGFARREVASHAPAVDLAPVLLLRRLLGRGGVREGDEGDAARAARVAIVQDPHGGHLAVALEALAHRALVRVEVEPAHEHLAGPIRGAVGTRAEIARPATRRVAAPAPLARRRTRPVGPVGNVHRAAAPRRGRRVPNALAPARGAMARDLRSRSEQRRSVPAKTQQSHQPTRPSRPKRPFVTTAFFVHRSPRRLRYHVPTSPRGRGERSLPLVSSTVCYVY